MIKLKMQCVIVQLLLTSLDEELVGVGGEMVDVTNPKMIIFKKTPQ